MQLAVRLLVWMVDLYCRLRICWCDWWIFTAVIDVFDDMIAR